MSTTRYTQLEVAAVISAADAADRAERDAHAVWAERDRVRAAACVAAQRVERDLARSLLVAVGTPSELAALEADLVALEEAVDRVFRPRDES